jgi:hypothetical protein
MLIRWSAASFRPTIKLGQVQAERPALVRLVRPQVTTEEQANYKGPMWI